MSRRPAFRTALLLAALLLAAVPARAQLFRAFLASDGSDANPCTLPLPCRLLPAALAAVVDGGQIWMLDSANYNTSLVNVGKSVTILAIPGAVGSLVATNGVAILINTVGVAVTLRNIFIGPLTGATAGGINMFAGDLLSLEDCQVVDLPVTAIQVAGDTRLLVTNSTIRGSADAGISATGGASVVVARSVIAGHAVNGVRVVSGFAGTTTRVGISDTVIADNGSTGFLVRSTNATARIEASIGKSHVTRNANGMEADSDAGGIVTLAAHDNLVASNTSSGIQASGTGARVLAGGNMVTGHTNGLRQVTNGLFESTGTNAVSNNNSNTSGVITPLAPI